MRKWLEVLSPKQVNEQMHCYHGEWMPQMDRCWNSDDGFQVCSRIVMTKVGRIEHVAISRLGDEYFLSHDGSADIPWRIKQEIKNELFGRDRVAIEVFPDENRLVDATDTYHLWVFPKGYQLPFGIHPSEFHKCKYVNRGANGNFAQIVENTRISLESRGRLHDHEKEDTQNIFILQEEEQYND